ncbi:hypothetical protein UVI_02032460 [Ustilaginoidea virens]|uniref:Uncharacterized protein n=1 Tax=Ustilaginoidea virens TaxID=1159556 RepID=A0A1B5KX15_USTVR|nr:hypothetical protein UVI_02032460 [Ustilaginoidea virens]
MTDKARGVPQGGSQRVDPERRGVVVVVVVVVSSWGVRERREEGAGAGAVRVPKAFGQAPYACVAVM